MISTMEVIPTSPMAEFVECYYFNESDDYTYTGFMYPTINQELFLNLGDTFEIATPAGQVHQAKQWISGCQPKLVTVKTAGRHRTAGVIFKPWGLYGAFGIQAKEIANTAFDNSNIIDFQRNIFSPTISAEEFFECIDQWLLNNLKKSKLTSTMAEIISDLEQDSLASLAQKLSCSKKSVIASFHKMVGTSPQKFFTLQKITKAIHAIVHNPEVKLTTLAYEQGFYDQSHFIRIFKEHTGYSPYAFKKLHIKG